MFNSLLNNLKFEDLLNNKFLSARYYTSTDINYVVIDDIFEMTFHISLKL